MKLQCFTGLAGASAQPPMPRTSTRQAFGVHTCLCFSGLLLVTWGTTVCRNSNCGLVTPDLIQRKNKKPVHLPKAAISKTRKQMDGDRQGIKRSNDSIDLYDCALRCMLYLLVSFTVCEGYGEGIFTQTGLALCWDRQLKTEGI